MRIDTIRRTLLDKPSSLSLEQLRKVDVKGLCDKSLSLYFHLVLNDIPSKALEAALLLDSYKLPRRGKITDESSGYLAQRAQRINQARNF